MLKKIFYGILCILTAFSLSSCGNENSIDNLSRNEVYFFYQTTCPHCHDAARYVKNKYPKLKMVSRDIKLPGNMKLFEQAVQQYNIKGVAGTPLICFGDKYIMGWSEQDKKLFDIYIQPYLPQE